MKKSLIVTVFMFAFVVPAIAQDVPKPVLPRTEPSIPANGVQNMNPMLQVDREIHTKIDLDRNIKISMRKIQILNERATAREHLRPLEEMGKPIEDDIKKQAEVKESDETPAK